MAQQNCYADSPDMTVSLADKGLTGMNAEDGLVLRFIVSDDRPCPAERFGISGMARHTETLGRIGSGQ